MFIIGKDVKIRFKDRQSPCYFLSSRSEKIKNVTKIEQKRFTSLVSFLMAFLVQKQIYTITTWFNFVFGSLYIYIYIYIYILEKCRTENGALRNSSINWIFLGRLLIQNHLKSFITEKRWNKTKYLTWNSIRHKVVKKSNMPNPVESLGYIKEL